MAEWRALHVYRWHGQDELLLDIAPLLTGLDRFFFLRYWRGGPHLRLRVPPDAVDALRDAVVAHLAAHPAPPLPEGAGAMAAQRELARLEHTEPAPPVPQDTVREEPYEPEYAKYGGPAGVRVAEELFHASSRVALDAVRAFRENPRGRLVIALDMLLAPLAVTGIADPADFLDGYHRFWSPYAPDQADWPRRFADSAEAIARVAEHTPTSDLAGRWAAAIAATWARVGPDVLTEVAAESDRDRERLLLLNYLHTNNNRMGITPMHEAYLAFLGHQAMTRMPERSR